jgi:quercetin dioxygenase-like cupin family protein
MPAITAPAESDRADFPRLLNRFVLRSEHTGGSFALVEHTLEPRSLGSPIHTHSGEDEYSYVLRGRVGMLVGEEEIEAVPGQLVVKPRGVPHAFWNAADERSSLLEAIAPGGFERYLAELAPLFDSGRGPDLEAMARVQQSYGLEVDPASIGRLAERFGLRI